MAATQAASCVELIALPGVEAVMMLVPFTVTANTVGVKAVALLKVKLAEAATPVTPATAVTGVTPPLVVVAEKVCELARERVPMLTLAPLV